MRVLVVDDDPAVRAAITRALRTDYDVDDAVDGTDALVKHSSRPADAIVLDLLMPELGGLDVCRSLRRGTCICTRARERRCRTR